MDFKDASIFDLGTVAIYAKSLREKLGNWRALEKLPLEHWKSSPGENASKDVLKVRKEFDVKKFREPARADLNDLNRGLASLGLGSIKLEDFIDNGQGEN